MCKDVRRAGCRPWRLTTLNALHLVCFLETVCPPDRLLCHIVLARQHGRRRIAAQQRFALHWPQARLQRGFEAQQATCVKEKGGTGCWQCYAVPPRTERSGSTPAHQHRFLNTSRFASPKACSACNTFHIQPAATHPTAP